MLLWLRSCNRPPAHDSTNVIIVIVNISKRQVVVFVRFLSYTEHVFIHTSPICVCKVFVTDACNAASPQCTMSMAPASQLASAAQTAA
jgi:hypothetical protein